MSCRQRMSATWAWNTVTPWSSQAAQVALVTEQERSVIRRVQGGREGMWAGSTKKVGP